MSYGGGIRHEKRIGMGDTADATQVQASHWNDSHEHAPILLASIMPYHEVWSGGVSELTEIGRGAMRTHVDLSQVANLFMSMYVNESNLIDDVSYVTVEYSIDEGVTWFSLDGAGGPQLFFVGTADSIRRVGPFAIAPQARRDVLLRWLMAGPTFYAFSSVALWCAD